MYQRFLPSLSLNVLGWAHTCNVTAYRNTISWQRGRDSWPRNVSKVGYAVTLRACSVCCRYLAVASEGLYGYGLSRRVCATWRCTSTPAQTVTVTCRASFHLVDCEGLPHVSTAFNKFVIRRCTIQREGEDNIKMDLQEVGGGRGNWMELAQDRDRWRALVGTVRDFRVP
jgi:hypothetical protein